MDAKRKPSSFESKSFQETDLIEIHMFNTRYSLKVIFISFAGVDCLPFFLS